MICSRPCQSNAESAGMLRLEKLVIRPDASNRLSHVTWVFRITKHLRFGISTPCRNFSFASAIPTFKTTFFNVKLQRLCKSHRLQCITSSKDSEKLEKSLCWMPVVFGSTDDSASHIGRILSLTLLNGPRNFWECRLSEDDIQILFLYLWAYATENV